MNGTHHQCGQCKGRHQSMLLLLSSAQLQPVATYSLPIPTYIAEWFKCCQHHGGSWQNYQQYPNILASVYYGVHAHATFKPFKAHNRRSRLPFTHLHANHYFQFLSLRTDNDTMWLFTGYDSTFCTPVVQIDTACVNLSCFLVSLDKHTSFGLFVTNTQTN